MKEYFFQNWREDQYTPYTEYEIKDDDFLLIKPRV